MGIDWAVQLERRLRQKGEVQLLHSRVQVPKMDNQLDTNRIVDFGQNKYVTSWNMLESSIYVMVFVIELNPPDSKYRRLF